MKTKSDRFMQHRCCFWSDGGRIGSLAEELTIRGKYRLNRRFLKMNLILNPSKTEEVADLLQEIRLKEKVIRPVLKMKRVKKAEFKPAEGDGVSVAVAEPKQHFRKQQ